MTHAPRSPSRPARARVRDARAGRDGLCCRAVRGSRQALCLLMLLVSPVVSPALEALRHALDCACETCDRPAQGCSPEPCCSELAGARAERLAPASPEATCSCCVAPLPEGDEPPEAPLPQDVPPRSRSSELLREGRAPAPPSLTQALGPMLPPADGAWSSRTSIAVLHARRSTAKGTRIVSVLGCARL